jgi:hypothetical protein
MLNAATPNGPARYDFIFTMKLERIPFTSMQHFPLRLAALGTSPTLGEERKRGGKKKGKKEQGEERTRGRKNKGKKEQGADHCFPPPAWGRWFAQRSGANRRGES